MVKSKRKNLIITLAALFLAFLTAFCGSLLITPNKNVYAVDESGNPTSSDVFFAAPRVEVDDVEHITFRLCVSWDFINSCTKELVYQFTVNDSDAEITNKSYIESSTAYYGIDVTVAFSGVNEKIQLSCNVLYDNDYGSGTYTAISSSCSAIDMWRDLVDSSDFEMWDQESRQYIVEQVENAKPISDDDVYFTPGASLFVSDLSLLMFRLNISTTGYEKISNIEIKFDTDDGTLENCSIDYTLLTVDDFDDYGSYYCTDVTVTVPYVKQDITLCATATDNSGATVTVKSSARSILSILRSMNDADAVEDYFEAMPNTLATVQKILDADASGYYLKAESGIYSNIFKWAIIDSSIGAGDDGFYDSVENTVVPIDNANVIYRIKSQYGIYRDVEFEFSFLHNNRAKSIFFTIEDKIITIDNDISDVMPTIDYAYWADSQYYYFTFSFLDDLKAIATDLEVESWRTDIDAGMAASDTEYTNSLLAEIEMLKAQYDAQVALVTEKETEIFNLKQRINEIEQQVEDLQNEIIELNAAHAAEIERLNEEHSLAIQKLNFSHKAEISSLKEKHADEIEQLNADHLAAMNIVNANLAAVTAELEAVKEEKASVEAAKDALEESLSGDNSELIAAYNKLVNANNQLNKQNSELKKENEELKKQLAEKEEQSGSGFSVGCGSIGGGSGSGSGDGGIYSTLMLTALGLAVLYLGVQHARKKNKVQ